MANKSKTPIAEAIERAGLEQIQVARSLGLSKQTLWLWCSGRHVPSSENLLALVDLLRDNGVEVEPGDLLRAA